MNEVVEQFPMLLRELRERSGRLSVELRAVAGGLSENGRVPSQPFLTELRRFGDDFRRVRGRVPSLDHDRSEQSATESSAASLSELEQEFEQRIAVRRALLLLDRLDAIQLRDERDTSCWERCLNEARVQRRELANRPLSQAALAARRLAAGDHPFEAVLSLVVDQATLSDERWRTLQAVVVERYGPELATAIVRQRLTLGHEPPR